MKKLIRTLIQKLLRPEVDRAMRELEQWQLRVRSFEQLIQTQLRAQYLMMDRNRGPYPAIEQTEFRCFSQNGEDGILHYIFSIIGTTNKIFVEMCSGDGIECNTANLAVNNGWTGLMFDGRVENVRRGQRYFRQHPDTHIWPPKFVHAWITKDNVNDLIRENGVNGKIDLLSLDLDGNDYWIWDAMRVIEPRVVVLEYQDIIGPERALTIPYDPDFVAKHEEMGPDYGGASLPAFVKLARKKGYRLVGTNRYGYNAFFVQDGVREDVLPEVPVRSCFQHPKVEYGVRIRYPRVKDHPWVDV